MAAPSSTRANSSSDDSDGDDDEGGVKLPWLTKLQSQVFHALYSQLPDEPLTSGEFTKSFGLVWELGSVLDIDFAAPTDGLKTAEKSEEYRQRGLTEFNGGDLKSSLRSLNLAVIYAPVLSDEETETHPTSLSSAYNSRSELLFKMSKYHECIADIMEAMKHGCGDDEVAVLFERQALCCEKLNKFGRALCFYEDLVEMCDGSNQTERVRIGNCIEKVKQIIEENPNFLDKSRLNEDFNPVPWKLIPSLLEGSNPELISVSKTLKLQSGVAGEKRFVATKDIQPGSVLLVEEAFTWTFESDKHFHKLCNQCTREVSVVTPCRSCSMVVYCSDACEDKAWCDFHEIECPILPYIYHTIIDQESLNHPFMVALRIVLRAVKRILSIDDNSGATILNLKPARSFSTRKMGEQKVYASIVGSLCSILLKRLRTLPQLQKFFPDDPAHIGRLREKCAANLRQLSEVISARIKLTLNDSDDTDLSRVNRRQRRRQSAAGASTGSEGDPNSAAAAAAGSFDGVPLNHLIGGLLTCVYVIFDEHPSIMRMVTVGKRNATLDACGDGMFAKTFDVAFQPTLSLFNHSCYPHVVAVNHGTTVVVRSVRHIQKGDEVFIAYSGCTVLSLGSIELRQIVLRRYFTHCRCAPCGERFSQPDDDRCPPFACPHCSAVVPSGHLSSKCSACRRSIKKHRSTLMQQYEDLQQTFYSFARTPTDRADDVLRSFLPLYAALDRQTRNAYKATFHSFAMSFVTYLIQLQGNKASETV